MVARIVCRPRRHAIPRSRNPDSLEYGNGSLPTKMRDEPHRTVKPPLQPTCICFNSSRLWVSSSRARFCSARASAE